LVGGRSPDWVLRILKGIAKQLDFTIRVYYMDSGDRWENQIKNEMGPIGGEFKRGINCSLI
jgi:hypothetical protein